MSCHMLSLQLSLASRFPLCCLDSHYRACLGNLEMSSILKRWLSHLGLLFIFSSFQISGADFFYSNNPFKLPRHSVLFGFKTITNIKQQQQSHFNQITRHVNCTVNVKTLYRYSKLVQIFCYEQNKH